MAAVTETRRRLSLPTERVFYLTMSIALFATVFAGFARSFYLHFLFPAFPRPPETIFYIKGLIFTAWCVLLVVQASLILADRRTLHRKLGVAGVGVAIAMVVTGVYGTLVAAARMPGGPVAVMPLSFLIIPLTDMVLFAILVAFGVVHRSSPQTHKRIMLIATIGLIVAGVTRLPGLYDAPFQVSVAVSDVLLVPIVAWDLVSRGRLHPATLGAGGALVATQVLRLVIASSPPWLAFCRWAVDLVR